MTGETSNKKRRVGGGRGEQERRRDQERELELYGEELCSYVVGLVCCEMVCGEEVVEEEGEEISSKMFPI